MEAGRIKQLSGLDPEKIEGALGELVSEKCADCGGFMRAFELLNGLCVACKPPQGKRGCSCDLESGSYGKDGYHWQADDTIYARCPAYWRTMGYEVETDRDEGSRTYGWIVKLKRPFAGQGGAKSPSQAALDDD